MVKITVLDSILEANDNIAAENRALFERNGVFVVNIMSSPGAGKTSLLERTVDLLKDDLHVGVVEGDIQTSKDSERLERFGIQIVQINTGGACHLDANMIKSALADLDLKELDLLFIENVGNLVCPAEFKVGEDHKVMLLSVPEGDEKPLKYPLMFRESSVMIVNKIDLLSHTNFSMARARENALAINPKLTIFELSCETGEGIEQWVEWLRAGTSSRAE